MSTIDLLMVGYMADPIEHTSVRTSLMEFFFFFFLLGTLLSKGWTQTILY